MPSYLHFAYCNFRHLHATLHLALAMSADIDGDLGTTEEVIATA